MIIGAFALGSVLVVCGVLFSFFSIPKYPEQLINSLNYILDVIFDNLELLDIFIRIDTIKVVIPILIALINLDKIYSLAIWILNKIPLLDFD